MPVERIASLLASSTEILYGLGLGDRVVAISHECDYPAACLTKPRVTHTNVVATANSRQIDEQVQQSVRGGQPLYTLDVEALVELAPQLIVTQSQCDVCAVRYSDVLDAVSQHQALRNTRVVDLNPTTLDAILGDVLRVAEAAGATDQGRRWVGQLRRRVAAVGDRTAKLSFRSKPRTICIEWIDPLMISANWMPELLELAGAAEGLTVAGAHSAYTDWADVVRFAPEVIVVMPCGFDLQRTLEEALVLGSLPYWSSLPAVKSGRVWGVDGNAYFNRSGPRMIESLELLAHLIHPELFAAPEGISDLASICQPLRV